LAAEDLCKEADVTTKPHTFNGDLVHLPEALTPLTLEQRWVVWRWEESGKNGASKWTKPPYQTKYPRRLAKSNDPYSWGTYEDALAAVNAGHAEGIGYMLLGSDVAAIDIDHCADPQSSASDLWAQALIKEAQAVNAYVEITVSGSGARILTKGQGPSIHRRFSVEGREGAGIEFYRDTARYITISGNEIGHCAELSSSTDFSDSIFARYESKPNGNGAANGCGFDFSKAGSQFGDIDDIIANGVPEGGRSEAFQRVVNHLAAHGYGVDEIVATLALHPHGIAAKYEGRLRQEVERSFSKAQARQGSRNSGNSGNSSGAPNANFEEPRDLRREITPAVPFPLDALGEILGGAARAIIDKIQCPDAIAVGSVLAVASLAAQAHADIMLPALKQARPLSLFFVTAGVSGERKSKADTEALWPVRTYEDNLDEIYKADLPAYKRAMKAYEVAIHRAEKTKGGRIEIEAAIKAVGDAPETPLVPLLTCPEPTLEGLHKLFLIGQPSLGLFNDEGGSFIGGHSMLEDNRLKTASGLSSYWDGTTIRRVRGGDGVIVLPGRRLALHLMATPDVASAMLSDNKLQEQGFLSRVFASSPISTVGTRFQHPLHPETDPALKRYGARILHILETPPTLVSGTRNVLDPRLLEFDEEATKRWLEFADYIEGMLGSGKPLEPIRGFANKLPEHAARIAGVLTIIESLSAKVVSCATLEKAIEIAEFYTTEALRLFEAGFCPPELQQAEKLLKWLMTDWGEPVIGLSVIYQFGPNSIRDAETAKCAVAILESHGWLRRCTNGPWMVKGKPVKEAWLIVKRV
jgi:hypothetical protein